MRVCVYMYTTGCLRECESAYVHECECVCARARVCAVCLCLCMCVCVCVAFFLGRFSRLVHVDLDVCAPVSVRV